MTVDSATSSAGKTTKPVAIEAYTLALGKNKINFGNETILSFENKQRYRFNITLRVGLAMMGCFSL